MGSKSPSTPDIMSLPANTGTNTIANNQSMIQRGFPPLQNVPTMEQFGQTARLAPGVSLEEAYNNFLSGPLGGGGPTPKPLSPGYNPLGSPRPTSSLQPNLNTESAQYLINPVRPGSLVRPRSSTENSLLSAGLGRTPIGSPNFSGEKIIPTMEQYGAMVKLAPGVSLQEAYNNAFGPLAIQSPDSTAGIMSGLPQVPTPPGFPPGGAGPRIPIQSGNLGGAMIPEQGPLGPGLVGGTAPSTGMPQPINQPPMGPGELINPIKNTAPIQTPTEVPQPMNPVTGNTSPIGGSQQDFDAYMNSYVNDLINQRMKNVFGGIMSSFS